MTPIRLLTQRLEVVLESAEQTLARVDRLSAAEREHVSGDWLARVRSETANPWIHGFAVIKRGQDVEVGVCGFKGPPDADGMVEIAYGIHPDHQGQGYATEAAAALVAFAFSQDEVRVVRAHTLAAPNASTRVLTKCGFRHIGQVEDPDDGLVWRWEKQANPA